MFGVSSKLISFNDRIQNKATKFALVSLLLPFLLISTSSPVAQAAPNPTALTLAGGNFTLVRDATASGDVITLTPNLGNKAGGAFSKNRINLQETFTVLAEINLGSNRGDVLGGGGVNGADGIAFVLQPNSTTSLSTGGGLGYDGVNNAFAVEFDTYVNTNDPAGDHVGLMKKTATNHDEWINNSEIDLGELEDDQWRKVEFSWIPAIPATCADATHGQFTAKYDLNYDGDFLDTVSGDSEVLYNAVCIPLEAYFASFGYNTYFGFTAATGGAINLQQVRTLAAVATPRVNTGPTITTIPDQSVRVGAGSQSITVTVSDDSTSSAQWSVRQTSETTTVVPTVSSSGYPSVAATSGTFTLSYTPSTSTLGTSVITVTVFDADGASVSTTFTVTVYGITPAVRNFAGESGTALSIPAYTATGFTSPNQTYSINPSLPSGLTLNPATGAITGTRTESQTVTSYVVTATDQVTQSEVATATLNLTISPGTRSLNPSPQTVAANRLVAITPTTAYTPVNFLTAPTYSVSGSTLPTGLTLNTSTGRISGTPTVAQAATNYLILASNVNGETATATVSIEVVAMTPAISPSTQTVTGVTGTALTASATFTATGFAGSPITYALSGGTLPAGLSFNTSTGVISGTPTAVKTATTYTVTATTSLSESASASITLTVTESVTGGGAGSPLVEWVTKSVTNGNVDAPYTFTLVARFATIYSVMNGGLPRGLVLNPTTGVISGTPTTAGTYQFTVLGNNSSSTGQAWSFTMVVAAAVVTPVVPPVTPVVPPVTPVVPPVTPVVPPVTPVVPPVTPVVPPVTPVEPVAPTVITSKQKVFFAMSSFALNAKAKADLRALARKALRSGTSFKVTVVGFTQPTAKDPNFRTLANNRAKAAANFLRSLGVKGSYSITGVGQAPRNVPSSRYAEVTVVVQSR
jgi:outer membrane protein OmpA-like peptidoglycan-associated protein